MKRVTLILLLVSASAAAAQREDRRGFIGIGIGPSLPVGAFADASVTNPRAGRAFPGYTDTMLNVAYRKGRRWGIAGFFSYSEYVWRNGGDDDWWQVATISAGPLYSYPLGSRAAIDLKGTTGLMALTPVEDSYSTQGSTGSGLVFDTRSAIRYDVFRRWALFAEGGFQFSNVYMPLENGHRDVRAIVGGFGIAFRPKW